MILTEKIVKEYESKGDSIRDIMDDSGIIYTSHRWLAESLPKRAIYDIMYGDLLSRRNGLKILDIGGGFSSLSRILVSRHNYTLLDILAHEDHELIKEEERSLGKKFWINEDWYEFTPESYYDVVIANDIFPNVDQRLELFLERYLPLSEDVRLSLTYYNYPNFYMTKRIGADEIFCQLSYSGEQVKNILDKYMDQDFSILLENINSLFDNGRNIFIL